MRVYKKAPQRNGNSNKGHKKLTTYMITENERKIKEEK